jgi:hypothetical protein
MTSASLIKTPPEKVRVNGWVFYTSTALNPATSIANCISCS